MDTVTSADGTAIAYERIGDGRPVIIVDGALCYRAFGPGRPLATALSERFAVYLYDRRGRGESTDTQPYSVDREVEDLEAVIRQAGGSACLYGSSSGAALAFEAASRLDSVERVAGYEPPFIVDDTWPPAGDAIARIEAHVAAGRRSAAVSAFLRMVGTPAPAVAIMRLLPVGRKLSVVAHTLPYDLSIVGEYEQGKPLPEGLWASVTAPALVMDGGKSPAWMRHGVRAVAYAVPGAQYRTIEGQNHMVSAGAVAPVLTDFFAAVARQRPADPAGDRPGG
ncbi:MAG TPA: alpha/beta hydrolase [Trebonia sp.]|jgi:pimeloyl-ACP methyl ester carboxylesterase